MMIMYFIVIWKSVLNISIHTVFFTQGFYTQAGPKLNWLEYSNVPIWQPGDSGSTVKSLLFCILPQHWNNVELKSKFSSVYEGLMLLIVIFFFFFFFMFRDVWIYKIQRTCWSHNKFTSASQWAGFKGLAQGARVQAVWIEPGTCILLRVQARCSNH
jgi:hypothetical protein